MRIATTLSRRKQARIEETSARCIQNMISRRRVSRGNYKSPNLGASLANDDGAGLRSLVAVNLHAQHLRFGVPTVLGTSGSLLVSCFDGDGASILLFHQPTATPPLHHQRPKLVGIPCDVRRA